MRLRLWERAACVRGACLVFSLPNTRKKGVIRYGMLLLGRLVTGVLVASFITWVYYVSKRQQTQGQPPKVSACLGIFVIASSCTYFALTLLSSVSSSPSAAIPPELSDPDALSRALSCIDVCAPTF